MRRAAVAGASILAVVAAATFAWRPAAAPDRARAAAAVRDQADRVPSRAEIRRLQAEADAACRCSKQPGKEPNDQGCWAGFEQAIARFEHSEGGTACLDESVAFVCFGEGDFDRRCVFRERIYRACSEEEAVRKRAEARARRDRGCGG